MYAVAFCAVDQNVSIVMALILSTQEFLLYIRFAEALILEKKKKKYTEKLLRPHRPPINFLQLHKVVLHLM